MTLKSRFPSLLRLSFVFALISCNLRTRSPSAVAAWTITQNTDTLALSSIYAPSNDLLLTFDRSALQGTSLIRTVITNLTVKQINIHCMQTTTVPSSWHIVQLDNLTTPRAFVNQCYLRGLTVMGGGTYVTLQNSKVERVPEVELSSSSPSSVNSTTNGLVLFSSLQDFLLSLYDTIFAAGTVVSIEDCTFSSKTAVGVSLYSVRFQSSTFRILRTQLASASVSLRGIFTNSSIWIEDSNLTSTSLNDKTSFSVEWNAITIDGSNFTFRRVVASGMDVRLGANGSSLEIIDSVIGPANLLIASDTNTFINVGTIVIRNTSFPNAGITLQSLGLQSMILEDVNASKALFFSLSVLKGPDARLHFYGVQAKSIDFSSMTFDDRASFVLAPSLRYMDRVSQITRFTFSGTGVVTRNATLNFTQVELWERPMTSSFEFGGGTFRDSSQLIFQDCKINGSTNALFFNNALFSDQSSLRFIATRKEEEEGGESSQWFRCDQVGCFAFQTFSSNAKDSSVRIFFEGPGRTEFRGDVRMVVTLRSQLIAPPGTNHFEKGLSLLGVTETDSNEPFLVVATFSTTSFVADRIRFQAFSHIEFVNPKSRTTTSSSVTLIPQIRFRYIVFEPDVTVNVHDLVIDDLTFSTVVALERTVLHIQNVEARSPMLFDFVQLKPTSSLLLHNVSGPEPTSEVTARDPFLRFSGGHSDHATICLQCCSFPKKYSTGLLLTNFLFTNDSVLILNHTTLSGITQAVSIGTYFTNSSLIMLHSRFLHHFRVNYLADMARFVWHETTVFSLTIVGPAVANWKTNPTLPIFESIGLIRIQDTGGSIGAEVQLKNFQFAPRSTLLLTGNISSLIVSQVLLPDQSSLSAHDLSTKSILMQNVTFDLNSSFALRNVTVLGMLQIEKSFVLRYSTLWLDDVKFSPGLNSAILFVDTALAQTSAMCLNSSIVTSAGGNALLFRTVTMDASSEFAAQWTFFGSSFASSQSPMGAGLILFGDGVTFGASSKIDLYRSAPFGRVEMSPPIALSAAQERLNPTGGTARCFTLRSFIPPTLTVLELRSKQIRDALLSQRGCSGLQDTPYKKTKTATRSQTMTPPLKHTETKTILLTKVAGTTPAPSLLPSSSGQTPKSSPMSNSTNPTNASTPVPSIANNTTTASPTRRSATRSSAETDLPNNETTPPLLAPDFNNKPLDSATQSTTATSVITATGFGASAAAGVLSPTAANKAANTGRLLQTVACSLKEDAEDLENPPWHQFFLPIAINLGGSTKSAPSSSKDQPLRFEKANGALLFTLLLLLLATAAATLCSQFAPPQTKRLRRYSGVFFAVALSFYGPNICGLAFTVLVHSIVAGEKMLAAVTLVASLALFCAVTALIVKLTPDQAVRVHAYLRVYDEALVRKTLREQHELSSTSPEMILEKSTTAAFGGNNKHHADGGGTTSDELDDNNTDPALLINNDSFARHIRLVEIVSPSQPEDPKIAWALAPLLDSGRDAVRRVLRLHSMEDIGVAYLIALLSGAHPIDSDNCRFVALGQVIVALLHLSYVSAFRPYLQRAEQYFAVGIAAILSMLAIAVTAVTFSTEGTASYERAVKAAGWLALLQNCVFYAQLIVLSAVEIWRSNFSKPKSTTPLQEEDHDDNPRRHASGADMSASFAERQENAMLLEMPLIVATDQSSSKTNSEPRLLLVQNPLAVCPPPPSASPSSSALIPRPHTTPEAGFVTPQSMSPQLTTPCTAVSPGGFPSPSNGRSGAVSAQPEGGIFVPRRSPVPSRFASPGESRLPSARASVVGSPKPPEK